MADGNSAKAITAGISRTICKTKGKECKLTVAIGDQRSALSSPSKIPALPGKCPRRLMCPNRIVPATTIGTWLCQNSLMPQQRNVREVAGISAIHSVKVVCAEFTSCAILNRRVKMVEWLVRRTMSEKTNKYNQLVPCIFDTSKLFERDQNFNMISRRKMGRL